MEISKTMEGDVAVIKIVGSMDALTAPKITEFLTVAIEDGHTKVVGDLSELEYSSSAGLRALLGTVKLARQQGGDFRLGAIQPKVMKVLTLSGFTNILKHFDTVEESVASFSE